MADGGEAVPVVGVVGLGVIGAALARVLADAGHDVVGYDVSAEAIAAADERLRAARSPSEVSEAADVVIIAVHGDAQVLEVAAGADGLLRAAAPAPHVVIVSTVTLTTIRSVGEAADAYGVAVLDCGITGGQTLVEHGTLVAMLGGEDHAVAAVRPVIEVFGRPTVHTGPPGTGMQAKIARNMIIYGGWFVAGEAARLAEAGGVGVAQLALICDAADQAISQPVGLLRPGAPKPPRDRLLGFVHKDLHAALELGAELGVELPVTALVERTSDALL
jgi:3-hydroxyisobutyrate dehydrogenase-like beta-hydroxyacid dehydrogenase